MEDQLVSFETAKLAKEKGFSSDATNYYNVEGKLGSTTYYENYSNNSEDNSVYDKIPPLCEAPTQSLLQKWLRDLHKLHINININEPGDWFSKVEDIDSDGKFERNTGWSIPCPDYESALEDFLKQGLSLI